ncbi:MAG: hypothetical protein JO130_08505 [Solirubrobacterales bacterium]|nr:hypothetical protein [Solirubrobacterales bacterium]
MRYARLIVLMIIVLASAATVALAKDRVVVRQQLKYKPHAMTLSGDGDLTVDGLRWRSWGGAKAVAVGRAVEQERPSHINYTYPVRVTLSRRTFCTNLHRTVYNKITAHIVGPDPGVFGARTFGLAYTCAGTWQLTTADPATAATGLRCSTQGMPLALKSIDSQQGTTCPKARTLVREWFAKLKIPGNTCHWVDGSAKPGTCTVHRWRCIAPHTVNGQTYQVTCSADAGHRRVRFTNRV